MYIQWSLTQPFKTTTRGRNCGPEIKAKGRGRMTPGVVGHQHPSSPFLEQHLRHVAALQNLWKTLDFVDPQNLTQTRNSISPTGGRFRFQHILASPQCSVGASRWTTRTSANVWASAKVIFSLIKRPTTRTQYV